MFHHSIIIVALASFPNLLFYPFSPTKSHTFYITPCYVDVDMHHNLEDEIVCDLDDNDGLG